MTKSLPVKYEWLTKERAPKLLVEMISLYGVAEVKGKGSNSDIIKWAKDVGLGHVYGDDEIAWCGLTVAYASKCAGYDYAPRGNALWARNWLIWGKDVDLGQEMLGDVLVFTRGQGGHVGLYVGEDDACFHVLGGNQGDKVSIKRIPKSRLIAARRSPFKRGQPASVRKVFLTADGEISTNEA